MLAGMDAQTSPLAVLSLIVAPAVLTNASSVLAMSTSNRLARATDRTRELARQLEGPPGSDAAQTARRMRELASAERRSLMLLAALRSVYTALGGFACAALFALAGSALSGLDTHGVADLLSIGGVVSGLVALAALLYGAIMLVRETRIVVEVLQERAAEIRARRAGAGPS